VPPRSHPLRVLRTRASPRPVPRAERLVLASRISCQGWRAVRATPIGAHLTQ